MNENLLQRVRPSLPVRLLEQELELHGLMTRVCSQDSNIFVDP